MAPRLKRRTNSTAKRKPTSTSVVDSLENLSVGKKLRFRSSADQNWSNGKLHGENADGSLSIVDEYTGGLRAVMVENCEVEELGPRGGWKWVPVRVI